jgi:hypothetical protein
MLEKITKSGFTFHLDDDGFTVSPADKLTQKQREFLKQNKPQIMRELLLTVVYTPAGGKVEIEARNATHKAWLIERNHKTETPVEFKE